MEKRLMTLLAGTFLFAGSVMAQTNVSGTGTVTDVNGHFQLNAPAGAKLVVSYLGMKPQTVKAGGNMKVVLVNDNKTLDEIVVTGYGNFKKSSFTGSASNLNTQKLEDVPVVSVTDKLAGGVAGLTVTSLSSSPGAASSIRIRGMGSINASNNPLIVIDGTPVSSGNYSEFSYSDAGTDLLATLNSNDIENITVIKDAAAASLYGSRAANGVIVITTKSGAKGKTKVDFRSDWGFSNMAIDYRPQLNGPDRRAVLQEGLKNYYIYNQGLDAATAATQAASDVEDFAAEPSTGWTDWKDLLFKTGHHQNYEASVSGGSENTKFYTSLAYTNQDGIVANEGLKRYTGNVNVSHTFGRFTLNVTSQLTKMKQSLADEATSYDGALANYAFFQSPSSQAYDENGNYAFGQGFVGVNPLYEYLHSKDINTIHRSYSTAKLSWNIWDGLTLSEKIAYDYTDGTENVLWDRESNNGKGTNGIYQRIKNSNEQINTQTQLSYLKSFGKNNIDALVGFETEDNRYSYTYVSAKGFPGDLYEIGNSSTQSGDGQHNGSRLVSYLGRVNYNYDNKYYLGASLRSDGSSRLARDSRWGTFWSVSGSWRFTEEKFLSSIKDILTDGKLRVSYGINGTQPSSLYGYMNLFRYGQYYNGQNGFGVVGVGNPDLKWEKNKAFDIGIDLTFLGKYSLTFDYYNRKTSDLIMDMPVSAIPGYYDGSSLEPTVPKNMGSMRNSGIELELSANWIQNKDFSWTSSLNLSHNSNKVLKLNGQDLIMDASYSRVLAHKVGEPYNSYYGYEYAGVDPKTGLESYYINDGTENARKTTTDVNKAQRVILGSSQADIQGGITNNMRWKFIDFGFTFTYQLGGDAYDYPRWQHSNGGSFLYNGSVPSYYKLSDMWTGPDDTKAKLPKFQYGNTFTYSSRWMMPLDYLRLKSLTLGFSVPQAYLYRIGVSKARFYVSASNLFTIKSKDLYVDPEIPTNGICMFETPAYRTVTFGIELGF